MSANATPGFAPEWLALREAADAAARAPELLDPLRAHLAGRTRPGSVLVIRDLGCGTGSMGRWLTPRLAGPQHWVLHDHDAGLLGLAAARLPRTGAGGGRVTVTTRQGDIARLTADELAGTGLVTASALLDILTREEVDRLAAACAGAGCPVLLALSVVGRVELFPADPLDGAIGSAFNDHQRRLDHGRRLLGPDAVAAAREVFAARGMAVEVRPSPWRLGAAESALTAEWLRGWVGAAREQRPDLAPRATAYLRRRLEACEAGELRVVVHHSDVLALPPSEGGTE
ncbi:class I SAM-dependent methyltransferase [Streptomyces sp. WAC05374]|uniref:methyltransferase domain-containing protein n=1 Tax=Streptomyces sp. WAC05374 TaxID=2487420 RepID=UPI001055F2ED|nr:class I SAM-dependent methyltransferase [Streptomyces sp. WAC05374]TDF47848.1 class I SAM-dependent methyltransferase [Streptomyces sp. WAC05374]TDF54001.1 class I SAM-dependent methyltransferase [Streptomyces sp. WAC05374]